MKSIAILSVLLAGFYIGSTKVIMAQLKDLENFYGNGDKVAAAVVEGQDYSQYTQSLKNIQAGNSFIQR